VLITVTIVVFIACVGKLGGCSIMARINGLTWHEAFSMGVMMNTRGLVELIVLNVGYDLGIIPKPVFLVFVIMAISTTLMTAPLLRRFIRGTSLQAGFEVSTFVEGRSASIRGIRSRSA
jgi:Kef-type K+ transport system membrane component KefB